MGAREKSWYDFFGKRFGPLILMCLWFATTDLERASFYAPSPEECKTAALPLAKIATKVEDWLKLPTWAHDVLVSTDDIVTLGMVAMSYLERIGMLTRLAPYLTGTAAQMGKMQNGKAKSAGPNENVQPTSNGTIDPNLIPYGIGNQWRAD